MSRLVTLQAGRGGRKQSKQVSEFLEWNQVKFLPAPLLTWSHAQVILLFGSDSATHPPRVSQLL